MGLICKKKRNAACRCTWRKQRKIEVGISIGIQDTVDDLLRLIDGYVNEGYKRMKVKIKPGWDVDVIREIRKRFPDVPLMADANSAYTLEDIDLLKAIDEFNLMMIEQPLAADDIVDHARLQKKSKLRSVWMKAFILMRMPEKRLN